MADAAAAQDGPLVGPYIVLEPVRIQAHSGMVYYEPMLCTWYEIAPHAFEPSVRVVLVREGVVVTDATLPCTDDVVVVGPLEPGAYQLAAVGMVHGTVVGKSVLGGLYPLGECQPDAQSRCQPLVVEVGATEPTVVPLDLWCDEEMANLYGDTCFGR